MHIPLVANIFAFCRFLNKLRVLHSGVALPEIRYSLTALLIVSSTAECRYYGFNSELYLPKFELVSLS